MQIETTRWTRRGAIAGAASALFAAGTRSIPARAATRIRFLTDWFAEAEHGGFYQAKATGLYEKAGLDVDIQMGGPQINGIQLLAGGDADVIISYDMQVLDAVAKGVPAVAIAAVNQFDLEGIMTHGDVASLAALKGRRILISSTAYSSFWPWLKHKFGYTDEQTGPYTSDLQPFFADPTLSQQAYMTDEPFEAHRRGVATKFFLFADAGFPPYGTTLVTTRAYAEREPAALAAFVKASMQGWRAYLAHPAAGNALIKAANPNQSDDRFAYCIATFKATKCITGGDAATHGIGTMSETRWRATRNVMVGAGMLAPETPWQHAFSTTFVHDARIMPD